MRRLFVLGAGVVGMLSLGLVAAPPALADFACDGVINSEEAVPGSIVVPSFAVCIIRGTTILGSVTVEPNGQLAMENAGDRTTQVSGGLFATRAYVQLTDDTHVLGSADIARPKALGNPQTGAVCRSRIGGELYVHNAPIDPDNKRFFIGGPGCGGNETGASIRVIANKVAVQIGGNVIGANLDCRRNNPPPIPAGFNTTTGIKTGQCRASFGF